MAEAAGASPENNRASEGMKSILSFDPSQVESDPDATRKTVERIWWGQILSLCCFIILLSDSWTEHSDLMNKTGQIW